MTPEGKVAPWVVVTGPSGLSLVTQLIPVITEVMADKSHQLITNFTTAEGNKLGLDTSTFPKNINGKEVGFRIVRPTPRGWVLAGDGIGAADAQSVKGRLWETTARGELKEKLTVREALQSEIASV